MSNIQFEEDQFSGSGSEYQVKSSTPKMVQFLVDKGLVKDEQMANYILFGIAVVAFGLALMISMNVFGGEGNTESFNKGDLPELFRTE